MWHKEFVSTIFYLHPNNKDVAPTRLYLMHSQNVLGINKLNYIKLWRIAQETMHLLSNSFADSLFRKMKDLG